jgi:hypothetical protein
MRKFFGKIRKKVLRLLLGREIYKRITHSETDITLDLLEDKLDTLNKTLSKQGKSLQTAKNKNDKLFDALVKITPKAALTNFVVSLVEHCNLKCWGCDHLSPLAEESFLDVKEFERDMERLAELTAGTGVGQINLMGGEPLLHPEVEEFAKITRKFFPETRVQITTNGLLLKKQPDSFWKTCRENNIIVVATKYPINIDWDFVKNKADSEHVVFEFYNKTGEISKTSYHIPFDVSGSQDTGRNFLKCFHVNYCHELYHGRLYVCTIVPHAKHFNKAFNTNMTECEMDSVDIYKASNITEILNHFAKPLPFCRYCNVEDRTFQHPWSQSKKEISEWVKM